jgi:molecular chaperone GrpE
MSDDVTNTDPTTADEAVVEADGRSSVEVERDEYLGSLQRLQADFENYRKRVSRDVEDAANRAAGKIISSLLPVLDAFDLALVHIATDGDEAAALAQSRGLLIDTLTKDGLERVDAVGVAFDPSVHDAVLHEEGDGSGEQVVAEVLRAGYAWKGVVLRAAMVKVKG